MNDKTGEIRTMSPDMVAEMNRLSAEADRLHKDGEWVPLGSDEALKLHVMNREQRRAWLKQERKGGKR